MKDSCERWEIPLYQINPIGVGTPHIESLSSYIKRLAMAHSVSPTILSCEILHNKNFMAIYNPASKFSSQLAYLLESMTGIVDTKKLYLHLEDRCSYIRYWIPSIIRTKDLFRKHLAWCPLCFEENITSQHNVYEQMFWRFSSAKVCSKHQIRLVEECPYCKSRVSIFSGNSVVGYCNKCSSWLGLSDPMSFHINYVDDLKCNTINEIISRLLVNKTGYATEKNTALDCRKDLELLIRYTIGDFDERSSVDGTIESDFTSEMSIWLEKILQEIDFDLPDIFRHNQSMGELIHENTLLFPQQSLSTFEKSSVADASARASKRVLRL